MKKKRACLSSLSPVPRSSVFLELCSQKTVRFSEQIMSAASAEKYPSIFSRQMVAIVYIFHEHKIKAVQGKGPSSINLDLFVLLL